MSLKNLQTQDLIQRWEQLFPDYIKLLEDLKDLLFKVDKSRTELFLIRKELESRNIKLDDGEKQ